MIVVNSDYYSLYTVREEIFSLPEIEQKKKPIQKQNQIHIQLQIRM